MRTCRASIVAGWIGALVCGSADPVVAQEPVEPMEIVVAPEAVELAQASDEQWAGLLHALHVLETGTREEKLDVLRADDEGDAPFYWIDVPPGDDENATEEVIERLRRYAIHEEDPWVLDRVLGALADEEIEEATPLFLALLDHRAASVRMRALEFLTSDSPLEDEEITRLLEKRWSVERTAWVRAALLRDLEGYDSKVHRRECLELMSDTDLELARAAIECVEGQRSLEGAEALVRRSMRGEPILQVASLKALSSQPLEHLAPFRSVLEARLSRTRREPWLEPALLEALDAAGSTLVMARARDGLWDENADVANTAIEILVRHPGPDASSLLIRRAREGPEDVRAHALNSLDWTVRAPELERLLSDSVAPDQPVMVRLAAISALSAESPSERFRPTLRALANDDPDEVIRGMAQWLADRDDGGITLSSHCGGVPVGFRAPLMVVVGDEGSTRCFREPGVEPLPDKARRISVGSRVGEGERFDDGASMWFSLSGDADEPCWVPAAALRWEQPNETPSATSETSDFEMPIDATLAPSFLALEEQGVVETFDRGATLVGVRLTVDSSDEEAMAVLREADEWAVTTLGAAVRDFVDALGSREGWEGWWSSEELPEP